MTRTFSEDRRDHRMPLVTANTDAERRLARACCLRWARDHGHGLADAVELWDALGIVPEQGGLR